MPSVFDRLKDEISAVRQSLKQTGLTATLQEALMRNQGILESYYDKLIAQNFITSEQETEINDQIIQAKRLQMANDAQRTRRTLYIILGGSLLVVTAIALINHYRK